jgi:hypothetical protein
VRRRADPRVTGAAWVAMAVFAVSTGVAAGLTVEGLLHRPVRDGSPQAVWEAYVPFLLPFGFQLG